MRSEIYCNHWIYECLDQVYECIAFICGIWNKKSFWSIQFYKEVLWKCWGVCENLLICGNKSWIWEGCLVDRNLQSKHDRLICLLCRRYSRPNSWYNLSREKPLMTPVIPSVALYCNESILFENDALDVCS